VGSALGPVCAGYLFDAQGSYSTPLILAAGFLVLGSIILALMPRPTLSVTDPAQLQEDNQ
jgi:cyanate permease